MKNKLNHYEIKLKNIRSNVDVGYARYDKYERERKMLEDMEFLLKLLDTSFNVINKLENKSKLPVNKWSDEILAKKELELEDLYHTKEKWEIQLKRAKESLEVSEKQIEVYTQMINELKNEIEEQYNLRRE